MADKKNESGLHQVDITTAKDMILAHINIDLPLVLHGSPGTMKSAIVADIPNWAKGKIDRPVFIWDAVRLSQIESIDLRGMIVVKDGTTTTVAPDDLPTAENVARLSKKLGIDLSSHIIVYFIDEMGQGMPSTQAGAMQLVHERKIGNHKLADNVRIIAATNLASDRSGVSNLLGALANRATNLQIVPRAKEWLEWARGAGIRFEVLKFLEHKEDCFYRYDKSLLVNTTARSWERVSRLIDDIASRTGKGEHFMTEGASELVSAIAMGNLDRAAATEFTGFCNALKNLKGLDKLFTEPKKAPLPENQAAALYLVCGYINATYDAKKHKLANVFEYIERMPPEFQALVVKDMKYQHKGFTEAKETQAWFDKNPAFAKNIVGEDKKEKGGK